MVWTFSRCGCADTHTFRARMPAAPPPTSNPPPTASSLSLFFSLLSLSSLIHTHTHSGREKEACGSCPGQNTEVRQTRGEERQTVPCQCREEGSSAACPSAYGGRVLCCCSDCSPFTCRHTVSDCKTSLCSASHVDSCLCRPEHKSVPCCRCGRMNLVRILAQQHLVWPQVCKRGVWGSSV